MSTNVPITVAHGDGIGPEIVEASLHIIQEAGARIDLLAQPRHDGLSGYIAWPSLETQKLAAGYPLSQGQ